MGEELAVNGVVYRVGDPAPPPLPRRSEAEVMARWQGEKPIVSIFCPTYQHVGFIEDALRGFLGQDTDFPFEILVRDDASTDGTAEIVQDYAQRYPNIIRAVLETENRWPEIKPLQVLGPMARGEFIALCEGDDYWIDGRKLQAQFESLLAHPTASLATHDIIFVEVVQITRVRPSEALAATPKKLRRGFYAHTSSMMFRASHFAAVAREWPSGHAGHLYLASQLGRFGGALVAPDLLPSVYRVHDGGVSSSLSRRAGWRQQSGSLANRRAALWGAGHRLDAVVVEGRRWAAFLIYALGAVARAGDESRRVV